MAFSYGWRGPNIVKDGLVFYTDPGSPNSFFNKSGTVIKDISGGSFTGTLLNGVGYLTTNGGVFSFDGSNDYITTNHTFGGNLTELTVSAWVYRVTVSGTLNVIVAQGGPPAGAASTFYVSIGASVRNPQMGTINSSGNLEFLNGTTNSLPDNAWSYITFTANASSIVYYINGVFSNQGSRTGLIRKSTSNYTTTIGGNVFAGQIYSSNMGPIQIYTRALTAAEILQNFNANKTRFGL
jgi:hypothetical protein